MIFLSPKQIRDYFKKTGRHFFSDERYKNCLNCRQPRDIVIKRFTDYARTRLCSRCLKKVPDRKSYKHENYPNDSELKELFWLEKTGRI